MPPNRRSPRGRCFEAALEVLASHRGSVLLAHGTPLGLAGEVAGRRYPHAWVELGSAIVVDPTMSGRPTMAMALYYRVGRLEEEMVERYDREEAERLLREVGHCGPWGGAALALALASPCR